jgi:hypothetical protein
MHKHLFLGIILMIISGVKMEAKMEADASVNSQDKQVPSCPKVVLQKEHQWLDRLAGDWTYQAECCMGPNQPSFKHEGTETVSSLGKVWFIAQGKCKGPDGEPGQTMMTLGYDPSKKRFVGSFVGSMMTNLWIYEGELDPAQKILTLNTEGPDFSSPGKIAKYQDSIEFESDDHRILRSKMLDAKGDWNEFMKAEYWRKK